MLRLEYAWKELEVLQEHWIVDSSCFPWQHTLVYCLFHHHLPRAIDHASLYEIPGR